MAGERQTETEPTALAATAAAPAAVAAGPGGDPVADRAAPAESLSLATLEFHALRAIRYHEARARFLDLARRWLDFLVVVSGTSSVTSLIAAGGVAWSAGFGVATAAIGAFQLVAGFSERAERHDRLRRKFCNLLVRVTEAKAKGETQARTRLVSRWTGIWSDEPPTLHVLEAVAYNATKRALSVKVDPDDLITVTWWQNATRNLSSWEGFEALTGREWRERQTADKG